MDDGEEVASAFFVAARNATEAFDLVDEAIDGVAFFGGLLIMSDRLSPGWLGRK